MSGHVLREIEAMDSLSAILLPLTREEAKRVLMWAEARFANPNDNQATSLVADSDDLALAPSAVMPSVPAALSQEFSYEDEDFEGEDDENNSDGSAYSDLKSFFALISPKTAVQKTVTCGWWLEEKEGLPTWRTFDITKSMKLMGKPMKYLSTTIAQERKKDIPFVEQVSKGEGQQAHGEYKLTEAGRAYIDERMKLAQ